MGTLNLEMTGTGTVGKLETGWSITESATPIAVTDQSGGTGNISLAALGTPTSKFINDNEAVVTHVPFRAGEVALGAITGLVDQPSIAPKRARFNVAPLASLLNVERTMPPTGAQPLSEIIPIYVGTVTDRLNVDYQATIDPICVFPGWQGDVWLMLKALCTVYRIEIAITDGTLIVRDIGSVPFTFRPTSRPTITPSTRSSALKIPVRCHYTTLVSTLNGTKYNYSENPSLGANATGWGAAVDTTLGGSGGSITSQGRVTTQSFSGPASYRARMTAYVFPFGAGLYYQTTVAIFTNTFNVSTIPDGESVSASMYAYRPFFATSGTATGTLSVEWLDAANTVIGSSSGSPVAIPSDYWTRVVYEGVTKPIGAVTARIKLRFYVRKIDSTSGTAYTNQDLFVDAAMLTNGAIAPYADGSTLGWIWIGAANNSASSTTIPVENDFYNAFTDGVVYSVEAGEVTREVIETTNYPTYLAQPVQTNNPDILVGQYFVSGADNLPVQVSEWQAYGGSVSVSIGDLPGTINLTLTGPTSEIPGVPGPYTLSASDGETDYPTLSIAGIGVVSNIVEYEVYTGADPAKTTTELGPLVDVPFINDLSAVYSAIGWASVDAGGSVSLSSSVKTADLAGFGLVEGATFFYEDSRYRVTSANIGAVDTKLEAVRFVTGVEFQDVWTGKTCGDFQATWDAYLPAATNADFAVAPLVEPI